MPRRPIANRRAQAAPSLRLLWIATAALLLGAAGCGSSGADFERVPASFTVVSGVEQLRVSSATPGTELAVLDASGGELVRATVGSAGGIVFPGLPPGRNFSVRETEGTQRESADGLEVFAPAAFSVQSGVGALQISGATPGATLRVLSAAGAVVASAAVAADGTLGFTGLTPGGPYSVQRDTGDTTELSANLAVGAAASFAVTASAGALAVNGATPGLRFTLRDASGASAGSGSADATGRLVFDGLTPGAGYRIQGTNAGGILEIADALTVPSPASFAVNESVEQLQVTDAVPGETLRVYAADGAEVAIGEADNQGSLVFRLLEPGDGYVVASGGAATTPLRVMSVEGSLPDPSFYSGQTLQEGFNYLRMRDGTLLSAYVTFPAGEPPYPTVVGYSGYEPSRPGAPIALGDLEPLREALCAELPTLCDSPSHPAGAIGGLFGFATVGVNIRGTGCSGGAYDYFETNQVLDGYDLVEIIASQSWVQHNHVGMVGISYPGITQLFTAQTRPPGLAAITPLSVIAETADSTLSPGGIFNDGFAFEWADRVVSSALPFGQGWEEARAAVEAETGETTCADNQQLHSQAVDAIAKALDNPYYVPEIVDPLTPAKFVDEIDVPVFLTGAWQDEQTGPHFATMLDRFVNAPVRRFTVFNGLHADGYSPETLAEWKAFLDIYVAKRVPVIPTLYTEVAPLVYDQAFGSQIPAAPIPFTDALDYESAKTAFEAQAELRVLFERGDGESPAPGDPVSSFSAEFAAWPVPEMTPRRYYLRAGGQLSLDAPDESQSASRFLHDAEAGQRTLGGRQPFYEWPQPTPGNAAVFETAVFDEDTAMIGSGSVDLWIQSTQSDADLEVLVSEVRPDGNETYVQAGWLRASFRKLSPDATALRPIKTYLEGDVTPLPAGQWEPARIEIYPFAHVFRAGSKLRLAIDTPGDSRERWRFRLLEYEGATSVEHRVAHDVQHPSSVLLPVVPGVSVPTPLPACPALRGQPCRAHASYSNTAF